MTGLFFVLASSFVASAQPALVSEPERIVFVRHGEKPSAGLGQLSCRGLNRALALPTFIESHFGRPDAIFAPDPAKGKDDRGVYYDYVRPLATIEPTAIAFGLPINAEIGFADASALEAALLDAKYAHGTVVVAWEHKLIDVIAKQILADKGGGVDSVPTWKDDDFDGVYVLTIPKDEPASLVRLTEGLGGQSDVCPSPAQAKTSASAPAAASETPPSSSPPVLDLGNHAPSGRP